MKCFALVHFCMIVSLGCGTRSTLRHGSSADADAEADVVIVDVADEGAVEDTTPEDREETWEPDPRCPEVGSGPPDASPCEDEGLVCVYVSACDRRITATCSAGKWRVVTVPC